MEKLIKANIHNRFDIEVIDAETGKIKQKAVGFNTICQNTWNNGVCDMSNVAYGSGTGTPSVSDTVLFNAIGYLGLSNYTKSYDKENGLYIRTKKATIGSTTAVGSTITEVGLGTTGGIYTHAMLQDQNGNQISIIKTSTDVINIYATVYIHFSPRPSGMYITYNEGEDGYNTPFFSWILGILHSTGYGYSYYGYAYYHNRYTQVAYNIHEGNPLSPSSYTAKKYISFPWNSSTRKYTISVPRLESSDGNANGGIRCISIGAREKYSTDSPNREAYIQFVARVGDSWFPYSTIENEAIGTGNGSTTDYKFKFMYPHDVVVKVNGLVESNVTIDYAYPSTDFSDAVDILSSDATINNLMPRKYGETKIIMHNPAHVIGLSSFTAEAGTVEGSNDLTQWTNIGTQTGTGTFTLPSGSEHYKYYRFNLSNTQWYTVTAKSTYTGYNLHFATAPEEGAIITASYKADCIAKDSDRVFDFKIEILLAEYTQ